jgi:proteic killer suppression protein
MYRVARYNTDVISSFACADTRKLYGEQFVRRFQAIEKQARIKLELLNAATSLNDLSVFPGNRLEKLPQLGGKYSIRINRQFRLCFHWSAPNATEVEIVDYH